MGYIEIFLIIVGLLGADNAPPHKMDHPNTLIHLQELALEISKAPMKMRADLISLAYNESRFGYRYAYKGKMIESHGDCGVFQQRPRFAEGGKTTCKKLQSSKEAVKQAVAYLRYVQRRFGKEKYTMCHYNSGNSCDDNRDKKINKKDRSVRYAIKHQAIKALVERKALLNKVAMK